MFVFEIYDNEPFIEVAEGTVVNVIHLVEGTNADLDAVYGLMERDFPPSERLSKARIEHLMASGQYRLLLARHPETHDIVAYAFIYVPDSPDIIWLDYMAVNATYRSRGYGTEVFQQLSQFRSGTSLGVFLEVERVMQTDSETMQVQQRRIAFYERLGAKLVPCDYQLPTEEGGMPMLLYFRPEVGSASYSRSVLVDTVANVYHFVHGDKAHREELLQAFIASLRG